MDESNYKKKNSWNIKWIFVAADSSKLGRDVPINICGIDKVNYVITDSSLDSSIETSFEDSPCELIIADK